MGGFVIYFYFSELFKHLALRTLIIFSLLPLKFFQIADFLNYTTDRFILRQVGDGYMFIHRLLLEHFANMGDDDIERLADEIEQG